ncbi:hypothetical protein BpHYR1_029698 [Brachionus plicatilis]|uniref:Uncharacterized protein n=1 Tax=Brachionus plicatilis TaxID=10195 RepID=A0A3M7T3G2_BRAPC|nr:hypothetical protein BpHYR1_029698 [Brachionus plicatilis]
MPKKSKYNRVSDLGNLFIIWGKKMKNLGYCIQNFIISILIDKLFITIKLNILDFGYLLQIFYQDGLPYHHH